MKRKITQQTIDHANKVLKLAEEQKESRTSDTKDIFLKQIDDKKENDFLKRQQNKLRTCNGIDTDYGQH